MMKKRSIRSMVGGAVAVNETVILWRAVEPHTSVARTLRRTTPDGGSLSVLLWTRYP